MKLYNLTQINSRDRMRFVSDSPGRSAVWLACMVRVHEVGGSNPLVPIVKKESAGNKNFLPALIILFINRS